MWDIPNPDNGYLQEHATILLQSFHHWTGKSLFTVDATDIQAAQQLFTAPFVLVSHGIQDDPIFNYANTLALKLFELEWSEFTCLPSRKSAEAINRQQRSEILQQVAEKGYCDDYSGIRISASGRRFEIRNSMLWNLLDQHGNYYGQAACFDKWEYL